MVKSGVVNPAGNAYHDINLLLFQYAPETKHGHIANFVFEVGCHPPIWFLLERLLFFGLPFKGFLYSTWSQVGQE